MAHNLSHSPYRRLTDRLNRFPQGAPPSKLLSQILTILFDQREADLVSRLPIGPFTVKRAAAVWHMTQREARRILDRLADKALLVEFEINAEMHYVLPPPMAGFFEFSMMRIRKAIDQRLLAELFSQYLNVVDEKTCNGCGKCVSLCPVEAMTLISANDFRHPKRKVAHVEQNRCLGCAVCLRACTKTISLSLEHQPQRVLTPLNGVHRAVVMAVERGKLQHLIVDNQVLWHHRALAALLGAILRLPPLARAIATNQVKSRYLEALTLRFS